MKRQIKFRARDIDTGKILTDVRAKQFPDDFTVKTTENLPSIVV